MVSGLPSREMGSTTSSLFSRASSSPIMVGSSAEKRAREKKVWENSKYAGERTTHFPIQKGHDEQLGCRLQ